MTLTVAHVYLLCFFFFSQDVPKYTYGRYDTIEVPLKCRFEFILVDPRLAAKLAPREVKAGAAVATITGNLVVKNNRFELHSPNRP